VVAAEAREFAGLLKRGRNRRRLPWGVRFASAVELGRARIVMVSDGAGPRLAGRATEVALAEERYDAILSAGVCGALDPALRAGDIFVGAVVDALDGGESFDACVPHCELAYTTGRVISLDRVIRTAQEKKRLHQSGAGVVEMEAAGVASRARNGKTPFYCIKAVTDEADEELLLDYNATRDRDGRLSALKILGAASRCPSVYGKELWRMNIRSQMAATALGEFLANCRF